MFDVEIIKQTLVALSVVSGVVWQLVEVFKPLFDKVIDTPVRHMLKSIAAGVLAWASSWGFGIPALNALGYNIHPALDAVLVGVLCSGGAAVFNLLFNILNILKELIRAKRDSVDRD